MRLASDRCSSPSLKKLDPPAGAAPAWTALRVRCITDLCHGGIKSRRGRIDSAVRNPSIPQSKWCSREDLHLEPSPSQSDVHNCLHLGSILKVVRHAGSAPAPYLWKRQVLLLHQ